MAQSTVKQFATELGLPIALLLEQLKSAGVDKSAVDDQLGEADKTALLDYLRKEHGAAQAPKNKITLTRKQSTEIKKTDSDGRARTIQVEVRKKRVLMREEAKEESAPVKVEEPEVTVGEATPDLVVEAVVEAPVAEAAPEPVAEEVTMPVEVESAKEVKPNPVEVAPELVVKRRKQVLTPEQIAIREKEAERHAKLVAFQQDDLRKKEALKQRRIDEEQKRKEAEEAAAKEKSKKLSEGTLHKPAAKAGATAAKPGASKDAKKDKSSNKDWNDKENRKRGFKTHLLHLLRQWCMRSWSQKPCLFQIWRRKCLLKPMRSLKP